MDQSTEQYDAIDLYLLIVSAWLNGYSSRTRYAGFSGGGFVNASMTR